MEQERLNEITNQRLVEKIEKGKKVAIEHLGRLNADLMNTKDFLQYLGKNGDISFDSNGSVKMRIKGQDSLFELHNNAITQTGTKLGIHSAYLRSLMTGDEEYKALAAHTLNKHSDWAEGKRVLLRSVNNEVRGVLSDSYKRMDSRKLLAAYFTAVKAHDATIIGANYEGTRFWVEAIVPNTIAIPTEKNGIVNMAFGVRLGNSEFGDGSLDIRSFMMQAICTNGMVTESLMRKVHIGSKLSDDISLSNETYLKATEAAALTVRDIASHALNTDRIKKNIEIIQASSSMSINLDHELSSIMKKTVSKKEVGEIGNLLTNNSYDDGLHGELSMWKLTQAITAYGRNVGGKREREFAQISGELMNRVKIKEKVFIIDAETVE